MRQASLSLLKLSLDLVLGGAILLGTATLIVRWMGP
jgi:hypothetical protein